MRRSSALVPWLVVSLLLFSACGLPNSAANVTPAALAPTLAAPDTTTPVAEALPSTAAPLMPTTSPPAGHVLYLKKDRGEVWSIALDGADHQKRFGFPPDRHPWRFVFSPDGRQVAYASFEGETTIYLTTIDGGAEQLVTIPSQADYHDIVPWEFSPDGRQLAFSRRLGTPELSALGPHDALWTVAIGTGEAHELALPANDSNSNSNYVDAPHWLDNQRLIYRHGRGNTVQIATQQPATPELVTAGWVMQLAPDREMLLVRDRFPFDDIDLTDPSSYRLIALEGQRSRQLREWKLPWGEFSWSPDGARIASFSPGYGKLQLLHHDNDTIDDIHSFDVDRQPPNTPPVAGAEYLRPPVLWTPDSQSLLYLVETQAQVELRRFDLASRSEQVIAVLDRQSVLLELVP